MTAPLSTCHTYDIAYSFCNAVALGDGRFSERDLTQ